MRAPATFPDEPEPEQPHVIRWLRWWDPVLQDWRMTQWPPGASFVFTTRTTGSTTSYAEMSVVYR